jgi:hypothetical protein
MVCRWAVVAVLCFVGCESMRNAPPPMRVAATAPVGAPLRTSTPRTDVVPVAAATPVAAALAAPDPAPDHLTLVAECLERGDQANAAVHLEAYVRLHPEQIMFRAQLAEMLVRIDHDDAAKIQFERFAADARKATGAPKEHLVHVHTRLMEIGQRQGDRFAELYHRGVGLFLLVKEEDTKPKRDEEFCEEMLCQAFKALNEAKELNSDDARLRMQLAEVYDRMGNRRAANVERIAARTAVVALGLEPTLPR